MSFVVVVTLQPRPLPSLGLDERFTRIDYTSRCTMLDVLQDMARVLRVSKGDLTLLDSEGRGVVSLEHTLAEYHGQHTEPCSSFIAGKWHQWPHYVKRQRREIKLKVKHTPFPQQLVTCTVEGGKGRNELRRATVRLPITATFGELLTSARKQRYGALEFEGPVYGGNGELETTLGDAWVVNGCKIDGTRHIGLAVVVSFPLGSQRPLSLIMGPGDTINEVKQRVWADHGFAPNRQLVAICGGAQRLEDSVSLKECCVSGAPVGGFSSAGWSELHLELRVKECVLPLDSNFRVALGDEIGGWATSEQARVVGGARPSSQGCSGATPRLLRHSSHSALPSSSPATVALDSDPRVSQQAEAGRVAAGSPFPSQELSADGRPATTRYGGGGGGGGAYSMVVFALSPSGRALMLTMPQASTVLDAKEQLAVFEGVSPCRQRLLWRGIPMEPDSALLHKIGVRSGDTLIVGYRVTSRIPTEVMAPVVELEGDMRDDAAVAAEVMKSQKHSHLHHADGAEHHAVGSEGNDNGGTSAHSSMPASKAAEVEADGHDVVAREDGDGGGGNGGMDVDGSADARARNGGVDVIGGVQSGSSSRSAEGGGGEGGGGAEGGEGGGGGGGGGGGEGGGVNGPPSPPPDSAVDHGHAKSGGRRAWWSKKKTRSMRRRGRDTDEQGLEGALVVSSPSSSSSSSSSSSLTSSFDSTNSTSTRHVRVSPVPVTPAHRDANDDAGGGAGGVVRGSSSASSGAIYGSISAGAAVRQQPLTQQSGGRPHFPGWARWKQGRRGPGSPISPDGGRG